MGEESEEEKKFGVSVCLGGSVWTERLIYGKCKRAYFVDTLGSFVNAKYISAMNEWFTLLMKRANNIQPSVWAP